MGWKPSETKAINLSISLRRTPVSHRRHLYYFFFFFFFFLIFWPCLAACRILLPRPGMEPTPPAVEGRSLNHWTTREVPRHLYFFPCVCLAFISHATGILITTVLTKANTHISGQLGAASSIICGYSSDEGLWTSTFF